MRFGPVSRRTVAGEIRERLTKSILSGELPPGAQVPSERDLCEDFGVARTSVREAVQGLVSVGLVQRRGNRTYVAEHLPEIDVSDSDNQKTRIHQLFEVRRLIEVPMAELTARRATEADRAEIEALAEKFRPDLDIDEFRALDRTFHWAVARACGNELLAELYGKVLDALFRSEMFDDLLKAKVNAKAVRSIIQASGRAHRNIAEAIVHGEPVHVTSSVGHHLQEVEDQMIAQLVK